MSTLLEVPRSVDELYLGRAPGVEPFRPLLQGDVFTEVTVPGVGIDHGLAMIISHPCNMRAGPALRDRIKMIPVTPYDSVPLERWSDSHFRVFPLPEFDPEGRSHAARFDEVGMVSAEELRPERRVACLSERGVLLLQQRYVFSDTRADISIETLERASAHVLAEAELLEEWNEKLVPPRVGAGEGLAEALAAEAVAFDENLGRVLGEGTSLREMLRDEHRRPAVRRIVRDEMKGRSAEET